jgi:hypothetical protein
MGLGRSVGLGGCRITEWLLAYFDIVTVPHNIMVELNPMSDYEGVWLQSFTVQKSVSDKPGVG